MTDYEIESRLDDEADLKNIRAGIARAKERIAEGLPPDQGYTLLELLAFEHRLSKHMRERYQKDY